MNWPSIENLDSTPSPSLLVDAERVERNVASMIALVGGQADRLRPHVKTHKMSAVMKMQIAAGITKSKTATIREAEMVAAAGGKDVLFAYQPVGPNLSRMADLISRYPQTSFAALTDDAAALDRIADVLGDPDRPLRVFIDVDCGMHRTGIEFGEPLNDLRRRIESSAGLQFAGLHVYDGHLHGTSSEELTQAWGEIQARVRQYNQAHPVPTIIGGGSPTFPLWATETEWECSPGTTVFWDTGYGGCYPDLGFSIAVALLTRVISKPGGNRICLDLGYKSVASEMPLDVRVVIPAIDDAVFVGQSEEHLVVETASAGDIKVGDTFVALPRHICPTVALHARAVVVRDGQVTGQQWDVTARDR